MLLNVSRILILLYLIQLRSIAGNPRTSASHVVEARTLIRIMESFEFVAVFTIMESLLITTNNLSQCLQRKDQDLLNVVNLITATKVTMQDHRDTFDVMYDRCLQWATSLGIDKAKPESVTRRRDYIPGSNADDIRVFCRC